MKKRLLAALMAGAMALTLTACGGGTDGAASQGSDADTNTPSTSDGADNTDNAPTAVGDYKVGIVQLVQHEALDAATQGFQDTLERMITSNGGTITWDLQNASGESANCTTIVNGFTSNNVDLIMANATAALQAAQSGTTDIPILGTSVTDYATALGMDNWTGKTGVNISGTTDLAPLDGQAEVLHELFPDAKNVGMLYCTAEPNSAYQIETITPILESMGYTCTNFTFADTNDIASVATNAAAASDVIYIPTDNKAADCAETINNVLLPAKVPAITGEEGICRGCGVATLSISYYDLGVRTGEMAYDILVNGKNPGDMEIMPAPNFTKKYNESICAELGITPPEGYEAISAE